MSEPHIRPTLPLRVPITPGESLESWLEALAARYRLSLRTFLRAMGIASPRTPYGLVLDVPGTALRELERVSGLRPGRLDEATLNRYVSLGIVESSRPGFPPGQWNRWTRGAGARFCPRCLAETQGRWQLAWYLYWSFVCLRHRVALADRCPQCDRVPRSGENRWDRPPDGRRCAHPNPDGAGPASKCGRCGADLTKAQVRPLRKDHPWLLAQRLIASMLEAPAEASRRTTLAGIEVPSPAALSGIAALMRYAIARSQGLGQLTPMWINSGHLSAAELSTGVRWRSVAAALAEATQAEQFAAASDAAIAILSKPSLEAAGEALAELLARVDFEAQPNAGGTPPEDAPRLTGSPLLDAVTLRHRSARMRVADRLAYRTQNPVPRQPTPYAAPRSAHAVPIEWPRNGQRLAFIPARLIPQRAWHTVTESLRVNTGYDTIAFPAAISLAIAKTGTNLQWGRLALQLGLPVRMARSVSAVWRRLTEDQLVDDVLTEIDALAETLTTSPPPIDYARRRWIFRELDPMPAPHFRRACTDAGLVATDRRRRYATMFVWETLTGNDVRLATGDLAPLSREDRSAYAAFTVHEATVMADSLMREAERHLLRHRINEPVVWHPQPGGPDGPRWYSPAPGTTRTLAGWESPSRAATLRRGSRDHTPAWRSIVEGTNGYDFIRSLARRLGQVHQTPTLFFPGRRYGPGTSTWEEVILPICDEERRLALVLLEVGPAHLQLAADARDFLAAYLECFGHDGTDPWKDTAALVVPPTRHVTHEVKRPAIRHQA